jgi:tripartite-type tricarboxylate transporter receptor subunit TctC
MINKRVLLAAVAAIGLGFVTAGAASAQSYPSRPIRIIVPFLAGGTVDIVARQIGQQLSALLGQPVVIDNRPGGGTTIALKAVATSEPDGYTLLLGSTGSLTINPILFKNIDFPGIRNLVPIGMIVTTTNLFAVRSALPVKFIDEFVAYAKSNPGKLNHGASLGVPPHLLGEFVRAKTGIEMPYVPYRSTAAAIPDFLSGQIQATSESSSVMLPHIQAGAARALVVAGTKRLPELPDVPTLAEAGLSGFPDEVWMGLVAPGGTPAPIIERLNGALNEALRFPETQATFARIGFDTRPGSAQEFAARIAGDSEKWARSSS